MRIGILINGDKYLRKWELRILNEIKNNPKLKLSLIVQADDRTRFAKRAISAKSSNFRLDRLGLFLLRIQYQLEKLLFNTSKTLISKSSLKFLDDIPCLSISSNKKRIDLRLDTEDAKKIEKYDLEVLVNLTGSDISGEFLNLARHGIWSLSHCDHSQNQHWPVGFWEIASRKPTVCVTLQQQLHESKNKEVIDKAHFNKEWAIGITENLILEGSVSLLLKNLIKSCQEDNVITSTKPIITYPTSSVIGLVLYYILRFYLYSFNKILGKGLSYLIGIRYDCWTIFIGKGDFLNTDHLAVKPIELPKKEFWADPFLFQYKKEYYVFFENYSYETKKGKISCGIIKDEKVTDVVDVLDLKYHLSFPYIFKEGSDIFLMPETADNKRLEIYKCIDFPTEWELYSTAFEGEMVADAFFYDDRDGQKWIFLNKQADESAPMNSELFIYKTDSIKLENLQPHAQNPVIIDSRIARNGGAIFEFENQMYRPSQRNIDGIYGRSLNINKIEKLTLDEYIEKNVRIIENDSSNKFEGMHHLHQLDTYFVFDAKYKSI